MKQLSMSEIPYIKQSNAVPISSSQYPSEFSKQLTNKVAQSNQFEMQNSSQKDKTPSKISFHSKNPKERSRMTVKLPKKNGAIMPNLEQIDVPTQIIMSQEQFQLVEDEYNEVIKEQ